MKLFLRLKAWQLFIVFMLPLLLPVFFFPTVTSTSFSIIYSFWMLIMFGWFFSVGTTSNRLLSERLRKNPLVYKWAFVYIFAYAMLAQFFVSNPAMNGQLAAFPGWLIPLHMIGMFFAFYILWFTARQFTSLMNNSEVTFFEYSGPFFLFWFSPIGVWFLQPKINGMVEDDS